MADMTDPARLATMSARELDLLLGEAELADSAGGKYASDADKIEVGRSYFSRLMPALREQICDNETIAGLLAKEHKERNDIIIAVAGVLTGISPVPYVLAARVLHYGYAQLCPVETA